MDLFPIEILYHSDSGVKRDTWDPRQTVDVGPLPSSPPPQDSKNSSVLRYNIFPLLTVGEKLNSNTFS
jgi:hypothetical protein